MNHTVPMKVSPAEAETILRGIPHQTCLDAMSNQWKVDESGRAKVHSMLWLFCWAKTGMGSTRAAAEAQRAFDKIFSVSYNHCEGRIPHEWARQGRSQRDCSLDDLVAHIGPIPKA